MASFVICGVVGDVSEHLMPILSFFARLNNVSEIKDQHLCPENFFSIFKQFNKEIQIEKLIKKKKGIR